MQKRFVVYREPAGFAEANLCRKCETGLVDWRTNCCNSYVGLCLRIKVTNYKPNNTVDGIPAMPMHSTTSRFNKTPAPTVHVKWIAMALPLAITLGCAGGRGDIVDYTVSESEYQALTAVTAPATNTPTQALTGITATKPPAETIASNNQKTQTVAPASPSESRLLPPAELPDLSLPPLSEPVMAAAKPATGEVSFSEKIVSKPATSKRQMQHAMPRLQSIASAEIAEEMAAAARLAKAHEAEEASAKLDAKLARLEALAVTPSVSEEPELAGAIDIDRLGFTPSVYTTVGLGVSRTNPDTSAANEFSVADNIEPAGQFAIGVDLGRFLSVEAHTADFGSTSLDPEGRVNYHAHGVSALLYAGKNVDRFRRRGLNGYARIGFNQIENSPVGDIPFLEQTSTQASFGLGAEYTTRFGLGFRADVTAFDGDVQYGQLGLLYRLASKPNIRPKLAAATAEPKTTGYKPTYPDLEAMPVTAKRPTVKETLRTTMEPMRYATDYSTTDNCIELNGALDNVNFMNGSARLTQNATVALNKVATTLKNCTDRQIIVSAHTDNAGLAADNHALSERRARAVAVYLANRGIDKNRMRAVAYGESSPVATNNTAAGRTLNRRVELQVR